MSLYYAHHAKWIAHRSCIARTSPTTKCSQIGDLFLGLALAMSARASSAQFARNAHAHNQYMFIARRTTDSNTVKLLNIG